MRDKILAAALKLSERFGFRNVTRDMLANYMEIAAGSVSYHFGTMRKLQNEIVQAAIDSENLAVIAQALLEQHNKTKELPDALKRRALLTAIAANQ